MFDEYDFFPEWLYGPAAKISKGVSPAATFNPETALSSAGTAWQMASNPRSQRPKKHMVLTRNALKNNTISEVYALLLFLAKNKFVVHFWYGSALVPFNPCEPTESWLTNLRLLAEFKEDRDYTICAQLGFSTDQLVILDKDNQDPDFDPDNEEEPISTKGLINKLHQQELPYTSVLQISPFNLVYGIPSLNYTHNKMAKWVLEKNISTELLGLSNYKFIADNNKSSYQKQIILKILDKIAILGDIGKDLELLYTVVNIMPEILVENGLEKLILECVRNFGIISFLKNSVVLDIALKDPELKERFCTSDLSLVDKLSSEEIALLLDTTEKIRPHVLNKLVLSPLFTAKIINNKRSFNYINCWKELIEKHPDLIKDSLLATKDLNFDTITSGALLMKCLEWMPDKFHDIIANRSINPYSVAVKYPERIPEIIAHSHKEQMPYLVKIAAKFPVFFDEIIRKIVSIDSHKFYSYLPHINAHVYGTSDLTAQEKLQFYLCLLHSPDANKLQDRSLTFCMGQFIEIALLVIRSPELVENLHLTSLANMCDDYPELTVEIITYLKKRYSRPEACNPKLPWNIQYQNITSLPILELIIQEKWFVIKNDQIIEAASVHISHADAILTNLSEPMTPRELVLLATKFPLHQERISKTLSSFTPKLIEEFIGRYNREQEDFPDDETTHSRHRRLKFHFVNPGDSEEEEDDDDDKILPWPQKEGVDQIPTNPTVTILERPILIEVVHPLYIQQLLLIEDKRFLSEVEVISVNEYLRFMDKETQHTIADCLIQLRAHCPKLRLIQWPLGVNFPREGLTDLSVISHQTNIQKFLSPDPLTTSFIEKVLRMNASDPRLLTVSPYEAATTSYTDGYDATAASLATSQGETNCIIGEVKPGLLYIGAKGPASQFLPTSTTNDVSHFDMKPIGRGLNTTKPVSVRTNLLTFGFAYDAQSKIRLIQQEASASLKDMPIIPYIESSQISDYESIGDSAQEYYLLEQEIPPGTTFHRLYSVHPGEVLEGFVGSTFPIALQHGTDSFYYVRNLGTDPVTLQFILKLTAESNLQGLEALPADSIVRRAMEEYRASPLFSPVANPSQKIPPIPGGGSLADRYRIWAHNIYNMRRGVCFHRAIAMFEHLKNIAPEVPTRIVELNNNHVMLEVCRPIGTRGRVIWVPVDVLGGGAVELEYPHPPLLASFSNINIDDPFAPMRSAIRKELLKTMQSEAVYDVKDAILKINTHANVLFVSPNKKATIADLISQRAFSHSFYIQDSSALALNKDAIVIEGDTPKIQKGGALQVFLNNANRNLDEEFVLYIDWDAFTPQQLLALNELLDPDRRLLGQKLPGNIQTVGFCQSFPEDKSFLSRYKKSIYTPAFASDKSTSVPHEYAQSISIDMKACLNWREQLWGRVVLINNALVLMKQPLFDGGIPPSTHIELCNIAEEMQREIVEEFALAKARGYCLYYGHPIPVGEEVNVTFKTALLTLPPVQEEHAPFGATPINTFWFDLLVQDKQVTAGYYTEKPGLIASMAKGSILPLYLEGELSESQRHRLAREAQEHDIRLELYNKPPLVPPTTVEELHNPLCFDVEDTCFSDLFYALDFDKTEDGFSNFRRVDGDVLKALIAGQDIVLQGAFSEELLAYLAPIRASGCRGLFIMGEWVAFKGKLFLAPEEKQLAEKKTMVHAEPEYSSSLDSALAIDFINYRKKHLLQMLQESPIVRLSGESGVGKSSLMSALEKDGAQVYRELDQLEAWALNDSKQDKILFIDEHNIENTHFMFLAPMLRGDTPSILYKNKIYPLDAHHKVVVAGNPQTYGGGRVNQKLFEQFADRIPTFYLNDFPPCYIYQHILKPILDHVSENNTGFYYPIDEIHRIIENYLKTNEKKPGSLTVRELQQSLLEHCHSALSNSKPEKPCSSRDKNSCHTVSLFAKPQSMKKRARSPDGVAGAGEASIDTLEEYAKHLPSPSPLQPMTQAPNEVLEKTHRVFVPTRGLKPICDGLIKQLEIKRMQKWGRLPGGGIGLNGIILKGEAGVGKSDLVQYVLKSTQYPYEKISASMPIEEKEQRILAAFHDGHAVWIDELNCCCDDGLEKLLNSLLTGVDLNGRTPTHPGFVLIGTMNGAEHKGRSPLSPALIHRSVHFDVPTPSVEDVTMLLSTCYSTDDNTRRLIAEEFVALQQSNGLNLRSLSEYMDSQFAITYSSSPSDIEPLVKKECLRPEPMEDEEWMLQSTLERS